MIPDKKLSAIISIAGGDKGEEIVEEVTVENFRMGVDIRIFGGAAMGEMECRIFGLSLALINRLTATGPVMNQFLYKNRIQILATNPSGGMSSIFSGNIAYAYGDLNAAPDVPVIIHAVSGSNLSYKVADVITYDKPVSVVTLMSNIAKAAGLQFENYGVTAMLPPCYYDRDLLSQIRSIGEDSGTNWEIYNDILYIWPKGGELTDPVQIVEVGKNMVGYPVFSSSNIMVKTEALPFLRLGAPLQVIGSQIESVNATWVTWQVSHALDSITPNGRWFSHIAMQTRRS